MDKESAYIKEIISSIQPLPPRKQVIGKTTVAWWQGLDGDAIVMSEGGSGKDRIFAESIVAEELSGFGYKRATFHFAEEDPTDVMDREREGTDQQIDPDELEDDGLNAAQHERIIRRQDNWNNLVEKAKRLVNSGNVTMVTNDPDYVYGRVIGDHGNYESEITRKEAKSNAITGWKCTCPWDQFAHQRTRQWKIYEGRPCSHILALYYVSKLAPTGEDEEYTSTPPDITGPPQVGEPSPFAQGPSAIGPEGMPGGVVPSVPEGPEGIRQLTPFKPEDVGATDPNEILEQTYGIPAPAKQPAPEEELPTLEGEAPEEITPAAPPPRQKIQTPPLEQLKEMQRLEQPAAAPGEAPYGQAAPPGTVSVPGARLPNERNPMGLPGGVYSKTNVIGLDDNDNYREVKAGTEAEVLAVDKTTKMAEVLFKSANVRCYVNNDDLEIN